MISLHAENNRSRNAELHRQAADRRRGSGGHAGKAAGAATHDAGRSRITLRLLDAEGADHEALRRLAGRDTAPVPSGEILGAELEGRLLAAASLTNGAIVADPFEPTAAARSMLVERLQPALSKRGLRAQAETIPWTAQPFPSGSLN